VSVVLPQEVLNITGKEQSRGGSRKKMRRGSQVGIRGTYNIIT